MVATYRFLVLGDKTVLSRVGWSCTAFSLETNQLRSSYLAGSQPYFSSYDINCFYEAVDILKIVTEYQKCNYSKVPRKKRSGYFAQKLQ